MYVFVLSSPGFPGSCRSTTVLHAERPAGPSAHWCVLKHQPLQAAEGLLLRVKTPVFAGKLLTHVPHLNGCAHVLQSSTKLLESFVQNLNSN